MPTGRAQVEAHSLLKCRARLSGNRLWLQEDKFQLDSGKYVFILTEVKFCLWTPCPRGCSDLGRMHSRAGPALIKVLDWVTWDPFQLEWVCASLSAPSQSCYKQALIANHDSSTTAPQSPSEMQNRTIIQCLMLSDLESPWDQHLEVFLTLAGEMWAVPESLGFNQDRVEVTVQILDNSECRAPFLAGLAGHPGTEWWISLQRLNSCNLLWKNSGSAGLS